MLFSKMVWHYILQVQNCVQILNVHGTQLGSVCEEAYDDREIILCAVQQDGMMLQSMSEKFRKDREIVLAAVEQNGLALQYAHIQLRSDLEIILTAANIISRSARIDFSA